MLHQQTEGQNPQESTRSLWRDKIFRTFWAGQSVSVLGTQITDFALPVLAVTALKANAGDLALLRAMETLPFLALTLPVGLWLDRNAPRPAMLVANLVRAVLIGGVAVAGLLDILRIGALAAALLIIGAATVVFDVAYMSYLPALVRQDQLVEGNSKLAVSDAAARVGGPGLAGALVQLVTAPAALIVDAVSYVFSAASLHRLGSQDATAPAASPAAAPERPGLRAQVMDGLRAVTADKYLRVICLESFTYNLFVQFGQTLVVLYAIDTLKMSVGTLGVLIAIGSVGAVAGSAIAPKIIGRMGFGPAFISGTALGCAAPVLVPLAGGAPHLAQPLIASSYLVAGFGVTISVIGSVTLRQTVTPEYLLGRVNALMRLASFSALPLGAALAGALASAFDVRTALFVGAAGLALPVLILLCSPVPRLRASFEAR
ncbi:MFS transporter [Streptomyces sp. 900116325]